jgi:hypothetical protein
MILFSRMCIVLYGDLVPVRDVVPEKGAKLIIRLLCMYVDEDLGPVRVVL